MILSNATCFVLEKMTVLEMALYNSNQELIDELEKLNSHYVICPSPLIADKLRILVPTKNVVTISKWITDKLGATNQKKIKKADLLIKLGSVWQKYNENGSYSKFKNHFDIFTELRSYSLELALLNDVLADYDDELKKSIYLFWAFLDAEKLIDEQLAYKLVGEIEANESISFVGFKFLNGIQIDMLKNLSSSCDITIFLPFQLCDQLFDSDWPTWLVSRNEFKILNKKLNGSDDIINLNRVVFPKGKSSEIVEMYSQKYAQNKLVLGAAKINYQQVQEVVQGNHFYKIQTDLFFEELQSLKESLTQEISHNNLTQFEDLEQWLSNRGLDKQKNAQYLGLKISQLSLNCTEIFKQYNVQVSLFLLELIQEVVQLNAPRVFRISLNKENGLELLGLDNLMFWNESNPISLVVSSAFGGLAFSEKKLSEAFLKAIRAIAPIRRMGLEYSFLKIEIQQALKTQGSLLLIDSETLEYDYSWGEVLKIFKFDDVKEAVKFKIKEFKKVLPVKQGKNLGNTYTASKLQNYLDCPQKYYYTFIESLEHSPKEKIFLSPSELGEIEHKIIEMYFSRFDDFEFNETRHIEIVKKVFNDFLILKNIALPLHAKICAESEAMSLSQNGIIFILDLLKNSEFSDIQFEVAVPANNLSIKGSIDCLITLKNEEVILIDLKRSSSAIGAKKDTESLKKIQLWVYALCLLKAGRKIHSMGYVCLKDPEKKSLFIKNAEVENLLYSRRELVEETIVDLISNLNQDELFNPNPVNEAVCKYCHVQLVCTKGLV